MLKSHARQDGFGALPVIAIILGMLLIMGAGYAVLRKNNEPNAKKAAVPTTKTPNSDAPITPTDSTPANAKFTVPELGIKFTIPKNLESLTYAIKALKDDSGQAVNVAYFSNSALQKSDPNCSAETGPLGAVQVQTGQYNSKYGSLIKQFDDSYVTYQSSHASCTQSQDPATLKLYNDSVTSFKEAITTTKEIE